MILYEDNHLLIIHKEPGELVQGDRTGDRIVLDRYRDYIKEKYKKPGNVFLHAVHRLDRPTSGVLILGRTSKALTRMTALFKKQEIVKTYLAITSNKLPKENDRLVNYIQKDSRSNKSKVCQPSEKGAKKAILNYELISSSENLYLYRITPLTGRSHQIRVQLAHLNAPIVGDVKYGGKPCDNAKMIYLHCREMKFVHPVRKNEITVEAKPVYGKIWKIFSDVM